MSAATPYAGAATSAAQPVEFVPRAKNEYALTDDWVIAGMRVTIRDGQYAGQLGAFSVAVKRLYFVCTDLAFLLC